MYYFVKILWLIVKIIPVPLRTPLRKSLLLSSWYTALLCKVGLHPSVNMEIAQTRQNTTSELPQDKDYLRNIAYQHTKIDSLLQTAHVLAPIYTVVIVVTDWDEAMFEQSWCSIQAQTVIPERILLVCDGSQITSVNQYLNTNPNINSDLSLQQTYVTGSISDDLPESIAALSAFVIYLGDELHPDCLAMVSSQTCDEDLSYVDTDQKIVDCRFDPYFLPDYNPDLQLSTQYIQTGIYAKTLSLLTGIEHHKFSIGSWLNDCYLSNVTLVVTHLPFVLVHRSQNAQDADIDVRDTSLLFNHDTQPLVSLVIPTYNGKALVEACIDSILALSTYNNYEILLIDNNSDDPDALAYFEMLAEHQKIQVLKYPHPFNYSAINNFGVKHASGDIIGLVNNDIEIINGDWLEKMVRHVMRPDIGCVGAKLLYSNGLVQHAGVVLGYGGGAGHAHKYFMGDAPGYMNRACATQNFSAVTAACLLVMKEDFEHLNGLNEQDLTVAFNDVDFCLRMLETGKRNLLCAEAVLYHHESVSRGHEDTVEKQKRFKAEVDYLQTTWAKYIEHDPAYNPNLTLKYENFTINTELSH